MPEIMKLMSTPANVFDRWKPFEVDDLNQQAIALQETIAEMAEKFSQELFARESALQKAEEYVLSLEGRAQRAEEYALSLQKRLAEIDNKDSSH
jgi:predicted  nucleic acid-binding Zn-ribbon protein